MAIVALFSASYCGGEEVAVKATEKLGYKSLRDNEILNKASQKYKIPVEKLESAIHSKAGFLNKFTREKEKNLAYIQEAFAELLQGDDILYHGFLGHLIPTKIDHCLKVCVLANTEYRVKKAMAQESISKGDAEKKVRKDDEERNQWTRDISKRGPWDKRLYDLKVPSDKMSESEVVSEILGNVQMPAVQATNKSKQKVIDFLVSSSVKVALLEKSFKFKVESIAGNVIVSGDKALLKGEQVRSDIETLAKTVSGVVAVRLEEDKEDKTAAINPFYNMDVDVPANVLLVDDEKEFVYTLSERLHIRNIGAAVAHSGADALRVVSVDEPEVMVLDLKMPGMGGMEVLRSVKAKHPNVEVIILTGHGSEQDEKAAIELGAFAYLQKPADIGKLADTIKAAYEKVYEAK